jgi:hypothetical protein
MRKNQANYRVVSRVVKPITLGLLLVSLVACATAPIDKARLQADKDWAQAVASAERYQQLQGLMLQGSSPAQPATTASITPAKSPATAQAVQPLLTAEEHRRQEIERREEVYANEWRALEHDVTKRVLQRGLQNLDVPTQRVISSANPSFAGQSRCRQWKLKDKHWERRRNPLGGWQTVLVERWGWVEFPCNN